MGDNGHTPDSSIKLRRGLINRLLGRCKTKPPADGGCWDYHDGVLTLDLLRVPELRDPGHAIRIESEILAKPVLVVHGDDDQFYAFHNHCEHGGRRLDPVPNAATLQCCSMGKSTYDYSGKTLKGPATKDVSLFSVIQDERLLLVQMK